MFIYVQSELSWIKNEKEMISNDLLEFLNTQKKLIHHKYQLLFPKEK